METHITFREKTEDGEYEYFVLQKEFPHYLGVIVTYPKKNIFPASAIAGYNFWVSFAGTLRGGFIPSYKDVAIEVATALDKMALWYLDKIIMQNEEKYKKFKIKNNENKITG